MAKQRKAGKERRSVGKKTAKHVYDMWREDSLDEMSPREAAIRDADRVFARHSRELKQLAPSN